MENEATTKTQAHEVQPASGPVFHPEQYLIEKGGDLGVYFAILFICVRWLGQSGLINDWRRGQQALAKLAEKLDELSAKMDKQNERMRDQIEGVERSVDNLKDRVDRLSDKIDRK